jgi:hypothetical protein
MSQPTTIAAPSVGAHTAIKANVRMHPHFRFAQPTAAAAVNVAARYEEHADCCDACITCHHACIVGLTQHAGTTHLSPYLSIAACGHYKNYPLHLLV